MLDHVLSALSASYSSDLFFIIWIKWGNKRALAFWLRTLEPLDTLLSMLHCHLFVLISYQTASKQKEGLILVFCSYSSACKAQRGYKPESQGRGKESSSADVELVIIFYILLSSHLPQTGNQFALLPESG